MTEPTKLSVVSGASMTNEEIANFMHLWGHHVEENSRPLRTLILVAESEDGLVGVITTGRPIDKARLLGVMQVASNAVLIGDGADDKAGFLLEDIPK